MSESSAPARRTPVNDASITPENGADHTAEVGTVSPPPLAETVEVLREQARRYHAMAQRRADIIDALANHLDSLRPVLDTALPGWWEEHCPLSPVLEEFEGWEPERVEEVRQREGLYLRGRSTPEQRADLRRRTTEAGLREEHKQP